MLFAFRKLEPGKVATPPKTEAQNNNIINKVSKQFNLAKGNLSKLDQQAIAGASVIRDKDFANKQAKREAKNNRSLTLSQNAISSVTKTVALYMPPQVGADYTMDYGEQEISVQAEAVKNAIENYKSAGLGGAVEGLVQDGGEVFKNIGLATMETAAPGAKALIALKTGKIVTPRMELMFEGIKRRSFSFTFTFIPKNASEAGIVKKIVDSFKLHMSPDFAAESGTGIASPRAMNIPDVFDIHYMYRGAPNEYLNKIGTSYLTNLQVQYGGDRYTAYEPDASGSPPPQRTTLTLSFSELELMDRKRIEEGY